MYGAGCVEASLEGPTPSSRSVRSCASRVVQVAARTYRAWRRQALTGPPARTVTDAQVANAARHLPWTVQEQGWRKLNPEGLYGQGKMTESPGEAGDSKWTDIGFVDTV